MRKFALSLAVLAATAVLSLHATPAQATQLPLKTWVSGTGNDNNPCSRASPCASFAIAQSMTGAGGEIDVVDSGDYGPVVLNKSISIVAEGAETSISAANLVNAMVINAGPSDVVYIRGLIVDGGGSASIGIQFVNGAALHVENCMIKNFRGSPGGPGILFMPTAASALFVSDTVISDNGSSSDGGGIIIKPQAAAPVRVVLNRVEANNNFRGIKADGASGSSSVMNINIRDSVVAGSTNNGIVATTTAGGGTILMTLDRVTSANNGNSAPTVGVVSDGPSSFIRLRSSTVTGNWTGLSFSNGATLESDGTNVVRGNAVDGSPSGVVGPK